MRILITGANGHLGRRLIRSLDDSVEIRAVVRRVAAREKVLAQARASQSLDVAVLDPTDSSALAAVAAGCDCVVHLIGMIRASPDNRLIDSHQRPARALLAALAETTVKRIVYVSILGSSATSDSRVLRARAEVESLLDSAKARLSVIRVPMVLGEGDRASAALARRANKPRSFVFRAGSLEQPIYAGDVIEAITAALKDGSDVSRTFDLAGPESLPRRGLILRAARTLGHLPQVYSLPLFVGLALAHCLALLKRRTPITPDMLRVLDHDDDIDPLAAARDLGIELTPLDAMLERVIARSDQAATR